MLKGIVKDIVLILLLIVSIGTNVALYRNYIQQKSLNETNITALTDTIVNYRTRNGELVASKTVLEGDINILKLANDSLYTAIKEMEVNNPSNIVYINTETILEKHDTIWKTDSLNFDVIRKFDFSNKYQLLTGSVWAKNKELGLNIDSNVVFADYTVAFDDGKVYVKSNNPYVHYKDISGIQIPKPKEKINLSLYAQGEYNFKQKEFAPMIGIDATYKRINVFLEHDLNNSANTIGVGYKLPLINF